MKREYKKWIESHVPTREAAYGNCAEFSKVMAKDFPELTIAKGFVHCPLWGQREHWWLRDEDGIIVDPTAHQFPGTGMIDYEELDKDHPAMNHPRNKCMNCGEVFYNIRRGVCSDECGIELDKWMNGDG